MSWQIFDRAVDRYEAWYSTPRGRCAEAAERGLLLRLLRVFQNPQRTIEIGCGTGHFAAFLANKGLDVIGLDSAPAMLLEARRQCPSLPLIRGDAHGLPMVDKCVDLAIFVTTLEFLEDPVRALREAVRIARMRIIAVVLNRHSLGGLSRRWGPQSRGALLSLARDCSARKLRRLLKESTGSCASGMVMASTLFPNGLSRKISGIPLGDVIGCAVTMHGQQPRRSD